MKATKLYFIIVSLIILVSCTGTSSLYNDDYPLTTDAVKSKPGNIAVNIPKDWFSADDNKENKIDLWLIKDDYTATISFIPVNVEENDGTRFANSSLDKIKEYSKLSQKLAHLNNYIDMLKDETFELNKTKISTYQFAGKDGVAYRCALFKIGDQYYECTAAAKPPHSKEKLNEIFSAQNAVLKSIKK